MGTIRRPELVGPLALSVILLAGLEAHHFGWLDQPLPLQDAVNGALRNVPSPAISEGEGDLPGAQFRRCPRQGEYHPLLFRLKSVPGYS